MILVLQIFTIAVSGNIANYLQNANKEVHWRYNYHLVSYAATAIFCYVWLVPLALWAALKWSVVPDGQDEIETQVIVHDKSKMVSLIGRKNSLLNFTSMKINFKNKYINV